MFRGVLITVLSLGVVGTGLWGYQEHREKNALLINAENNYQRAFHNLTQQVDVLHDKIGTTLAMNSRQSLSPTLAEVWRITSEAHNDVGQLPLTLLPFNKTEEFLAKIGGFSYQVAVRDLDKEPLNDKEYATLKTLYSQAGEIQDELRNVQHLAMKNNIRWMDVELALASGKEPADNTIIDGFKTVESKVEGYNETDLGPAFGNLNEKGNNINFLEGENFSKEEAIKKAEKYIGLGKDTEIQITESGKGSDFAFYSISMENKKNNKYPIWIYQK